MNRMFHILIMAFAVMGLISSCRDPEPLTAITHTIQGVTFEMVFVEDSSVVMGATAEQSGDADDDEYPTHNVVLTDYYIGKTEVTQELWKAVMGENPSYFKGDNKPVHNISWYDCQRFIDKLNMHTGKNFCFPTEAQWEYAARGGNMCQGYKYAGSNIIDEVAWYGEDYDECRPHKVSTKYANELGIYDMSGNVGEWCLDWYDNYTDSSQTNPEGPSAGSLRVFRGGCYYSATAKDCRVTYRDNVNSGYRGSDIGLRLCIVL